MVTHASLACICPKSSFEKEAEFNDYIFTAKIIDMSLRTYSLKVVYSWKGSLSDTITIGRDMSSCHRFRMELGREYLIYMERFDRGVSHCSRSVEIQYSQDLSKLHKLFKTRESNEKNRHFEIENQYFQSVLKYSGIHYFENSNSTYFVFRDYRNEKFQILTMNEFIKFDHEGSIPYLQKITLKKKKMDENLKLYTFTPGYTLDKKMMKTLIRDYKACKKYSICDL